MKHFLHASIEHRRGFVPFLSALCAMLGCAAPWFACARLSGQCADSSRCRVTMLRVCDTANECRAYACGTCSDLRHICLECPRVRDGCSSFWHQCQLPVQQREELSSSQSRSGQVLWCCATLVPCHACCNLGAHTGPSHSERQATCMRFACKFPLLRACRQTHCINDKPTMQQSLLPAGSQFSVTSL